MQILSQDEQDFLSEVMDGDLSEEDLINLHNMIEDRELNSWMQEEFADVFGG